MPNNIHASSIIEPSVKLGDNITVGPFCYISGEVEIGDDCVLNSHVVISGKTKIGKANIFHPFANIGAEPQDLKFEGEDSSTIIGDNNVFRENVTIHSGTTTGNKYHDLYNITKVGSGGLYMVGSHVAHDCVVGDNVILANNATLAGHVSVGDNVIVGGLSAVQQFVRIGDHAIIGGMSGIENDVVPYALVMGDRASLAGINLVGLKRRKFSKDEILNIKSAYDLLFEGDDQNFADRIELLSEKFANDNKVKLIIDFLNSSAQKAILKPKNYKK